MSNQLQIAVNEFLDTIEGMENRMFRNIKLLILDNNISMRELVTTTQQIDFFERMNAMGFQTAMQRYLNIYDDKIREIKRVAEERGVIIKSAMLDDLIKIKNIDTDYILARARMYSSELKSGLVKIMIGGYSRQELTKELLPILQSEVNFKAHWFEVVLNEHIKQFAMTGLFSAFEDEPQMKFKLLHPLDTNTRDLCKEAIMIFNNNPDGLTKTQIEKIDNPKKPEQRYSVIKLGGWNCRGDLIVV